ncbi:MAG: accessory factor UbiK family protein [Gammaproteobacteria bacterium]|nr:accessory factor UbiK family protein [Gammaproteobacteria bacterium]
MKINPQHLDETISKLKELLPADISDFKNTGEQKLKLILEGMLQKLDMVSREEYEVQAEVLKRTRQRLEQLEQRIALLEDN